MKAIRVRCAIANSLPVVYRMFLTALLFCLLQAQAQAQVNSPQPRDPQPEKLFAAETMLTISLTAPWRDIVRKNPTQREYPAELVYTDERGESRSLPLSIERRGITRLRICEFPPIKLRFDKEAVRDSMFRGQKSIKMVTHCDKGERWTQYYVKEMLAYRMYNLMTDKSFRVRPLSVTYIDSGKNSADVPRFAFLIEDDSDVAQRNDLEKIILDDITPVQLRPLDASRFMLFQLMIGNVDWSALGSAGDEDCCHNAKLLGRDPNNDLYLIPYDFDSSGLVDASYAAPNEGLPIRQVTQRLYRGYCVHNSTVDTARQEFLDKEQQIRALAANESKLNSGSLKTLNRYLDGFFNLIKDDQAVAKKIIAKCRT